jgi:hypothetical protein
LASLFERLTVFPDSILATDTGVGKHYVDTFTWRPFDGSLEQCNLILPSQDVALHECYFVLANLGGNTLAMLL